MQQKFEQSGRLSQDQALAPHQIQGLEMLQLPAMELQARLEQELAENPTLEMDGPEQIPTGDLFSAQELDDQPEGQAGDEPLDLRRLIEAQQWQKPLGAVDVSEEDRQRRHLFESAQSEIGLIEFLEEQIRHLFDQEQERELAYAAISFLDERGYLQASLPEVALAANAPLAAVEPVLQRIRHQCDPPGVAAVDLRQCLLLQGQRRWGEQALPCQLLERFHQELESGDLSQVMRKLRCSQEQLQAALAQLRQLQPAPGLAFARREVQYVSPDLVIEEDQGQLHCLLARQNLPRLRLSDSCLDLLADPQTPSPTKAYLRERIANSRQLMNALDLRASTLQRIGEVVTERQRDYLLGRSSELVPCTLKDCASILGLHEATISRAVSGKYVQGPRGLIPLRQLFSLEALEGSGLTAKAISARIAAIIADEDPLHPRTDVELARQLAEQGLPMALRTVTKYREAAGLSASHRRRQRLSGH